MVRVTELREDEHVQVEGTPHKSTSKGRRVPSCVSGVGREIRMKTS